MRVQIVIIHVSEAHEVILHAQVHEVHVIVHACVAIRVNEVRVLEVHVIILAVPVHVVHVLISAFFHG